MDLQLNRLLMADLDKRRLQVMDVFNERPSELCLINQNSEEVHNLQSPDENKILVLLSPLVERFSISRLRDFWKPGDINSYKEKKTYLKNFGY